jgi:hypothetical protein
MGRRGKPRLYSLVNLVLLQLLKKLASRTRDVDSAGDVAFPIFHALNDAGFFAALWACGRFRGVHDLLTVGCLCNFRHSVLS